MSMMNNNEILKEQVSREIDILRDEMVRIAQSMFIRPEIGYQEYESSKLLSEFLKGHGFEVTSNVAGMETAFFGTYSQDSEGPTIALLAEYDALPGMGHACGHHLIGTASAGAAVGLSKVFSQLKGKIAVVGCPAEEGGIDNAGGKVRLVEGGYFDRIDAAMIFHPMPLTTVGGQTSALIGLELEFKGKAAHAAGNPWDGINALDGVLQTYNAINALRQHLKEDIRIHGIVTHGGDAPNIVPEYAVARFFVRSEDNKRLRETVVKVENCARGAALATGTELNIKRFNHLYETMNSNSVLAEVLKKNVERIGLRIEGIKKGKGSTDFGNVSGIVPACELAIRLGNGIVPHTKEFLNASSSEEGYNVMILGAKVMAMSAIDLLQSPDLLERAKEELRTVLR
jgi:amidohydrolase